MLALRTSTAAIALMVLGTACASPRYGSTTSSPATSEGSSGGSYYPAEGAYGGAEEMDAEIAAAPSPVLARSPGSASVDFQASVLSLESPASDTSGARRDRAGGADHRAEPQQAPSVQYAQADVAPRRASGPAARPPSSPTATDAIDTSGPLLIYTATFHLAVYEVRESQAAIAAAAREAGGFVFSQSDDRIVVRVPAPRFHAMLDRVEQAGEVEHRDVQAQDVSEEFRDVEIRIRNLEAMRARVEQLLAQARTVEEALQVEQQLRRITEELELLRGRQRFLADRVAFSTLTVLFRPRARELIGQPDVFELPFDWLGQLGLPTLLDLRR